MLFVWKEGLFNLFQGLSVIVLCFRHSTIHFVLRESPVNMSWAVEEWKEGLCPRVLQKIHELESQVGKLKKERQQRQFQLESLEAALEKQKQKVM